MDKLSARRFVKALRAAQELLISEARCFRYDNDREYQEIVEDLKFAIRMLEDGEELAGKLLYKNATKIPYMKALDMAQTARDPDEHMFFLYLAEQNVVKQTCNSGQSEDVKIKTMSNYIIKRYKTAWEALAKEE